jgi:integrase
MSIKRTSSGKWQYRYRDLQGYQRAKNFELKKDAENFAAQNRMAMASGAWIAPTKSKLTVGHLWEDFAALKGSKKRKTRVDYESIWRTHLQATWAEVPASRVTQIEFMKWLLAKGCSPARADKIHLLMTMILDVGVEGGRVPRNVLLTKRGRRAKSDLPPIPKSEQGEALTLKQLIQLAEECSPYSEVILLLGLGGLRFGEVAGLKVSCVDFATNRIHIRESLLEVSGDLYTETPKNHKKRTFVAPQSLMDALKPLCEDKDGESYVFLTGQGTPLRNSNFSKRIYKPALKRLGLPNIRIHDLRHTAVSIAKSVGGDIFDAKNQVGHSDIRTTINIYGHIFEEDSLDLAQKIDIALKNVH